MENTGKSPISTDRKTNEKNVDSSPSAKPNGKSIASSVTIDSSASVKPNEKSTASSAIAKKLNKKAAISSANPMYPTAVTALSSAHGDQVMLFRDISHGPREAELMFRLIHFWEARNPNTKTLIGQEMLLIDEEVCLFYFF